MCKRPMTGIIFLSITTLHIITIGFAVRTSVGSLAVLTGFLVTFHRSSRQMLENYLKLVHDRFLSRSYQFTLNNGSLIRRHEFKA